MGAMECSKLKNYPRSGRAKRNEHAENFVNFLNYVSTVKQFILVKMKSVTDYSRFEHSTILFEFMTATTGRRGRLDGLLRAPALVYWRARVHANTIGIAVIVRRRIFENIRKLKMDEAVCEINISRLI